MQGGNMKLFQKKNKKLIIYVAFLSILFPLLAWFHVNNPYFYHFRFLKLLMYSLILLVPVILKVLLGRASISIGSSGLYVLIYLFYFSLILLLSYRYSISKKKKRFLIWLVVGLLSYIAVTLFFLL